MDKYLPCALPFTDLDVQFQLTVNVTAVVLTFVSAVASATGESVLNAVQLLWVNLIMDTFAALALATDPPSRTVLDRKPDRKSAALITIGMAKMIIGQAICQLAITLVLNFAGGQLLGYNGMEDGYTRLKTLVFNTFVWLQIFNEVNNRRLDSKLNVLEGIHRNYWFLGINTIMVAGQVLIIFVGGPAFKIKPLDGKEWGLSIGLGAISLPVGALIRKVPDWILLKLLPKFIQRRWVPETLPEEEQEALRKDLEAKRGASASVASKDQDRGDEDASSLTDGDGERDFQRPPLRVMTTIRGNRARSHSIWGSHRNPKQYMHNKKDELRAKVATHGHSIDARSRLDEEELRPRSATAPAGPSSPAV